ncbi:MAG: uracil-DNA glycosylase [Phycisphaerales bacterium]
MDAATDDRRHALPRVLAAFDRAIGLDSTLRTSVAVAAPAASVPPKVAMPVAVPPAAVTPSAAAPVRAASLPESSLRAPGDRAARTARLAEIAARHAATCPHCTRATGWTNLVFGEGAPDAAVMFVGEAPGETEDRAGRPFVGPAGEKLDEMIKARGLARDDVYVANVLKARPPGNRTPLPDEVAACAPFLVEQILTVQPKAIVALGGSAVRALLGIDTGITRLRGEWLAWEPPAGAECPASPVMPTYHPSYVLRTYTVEVRRQVWHDLRAVMARVGLGG